MSATSIITDIEVIVAEKRPCTLRDWVAPLRFKFGNLQCEMRWSWFNDCVPEPAAQRILDLIVSDLGKSGIVVLGQLNGYEMAGRAA